MHEIYKQTVRQTDKRRTKGDKRVYLTYLYETFGQTFVYFNKLKSNKF